MVNNTMQNALELTNFIPSIPKKISTDPSPYREGTPIPRTTQPRRRSFSAFGTLTVAHSALKLWRASEQKFTTTLLTDGVINVTSRSFSSLFPSLLAGVTVWMLKCRLDAVGWAAGRASGL